MTETPHPTDPTDGAGSRRSWRRYGPAAGLVLGGVVATAVLTGTFTANAATGTGTEQPSSGVSSYVVPGQDYTLPRAPGAESDGTAARDCPAGAGPDAAGGTPQGATAESQPSTSDQTL